MKRAGLKRARLKREGQTETGSALKRVGLTRERVEDGETEWIVRAVLCGQ